MPNTLGRQGDVLEFSRFRRDFPDVDEASFARLDDVMLEIGDYQSSSLASLLSAWASSIARFERELDTPNPLSDNVWHEYDYFATLLDRDRLEGACALATGAIHDLAQELVRTVDNRFETFTVADDDGTVQLFSQPLAANASGWQGSGWWWKRMPVRGAVPEGLRAFLAEGP